MKSTREVLICLLAEMVFQHCEEDNDGVFRTGFIGINEDAMRTLVEEGVMILINDGHGRVYDAKFLVADDPIVSVRKALEATTK